MSHDMISPMQQGQLTTDPDQLRAISAREGATLVLAGAGSGKTRVLTERIVYLITQQGYAPDRICALTFTNKAARHMQDRIRMALIAQSVNHAGILTVTTFHSLAYAFVQMYGQALGYRADVTIYDDLDQQSVIKELCRLQGLDVAQVDPRGLASYFARIKETYFEGALPIHHIRYGEMLVSYNQHLKSHHAIDFADMLVLFYRLLAHPETRVPIVDRWDYVLVDEFQDTNAIQFAILKHLVSSHGNIFVVGDEDQSIYRFRGAVIQNIVNFDRIFSGAEVISLKRNYRSTQCIVAAASHVINHNRTRRAKKDMQAVGSPGEEIRVCYLSSDEEEAEKVTDMMAHFLSQGRKLSDMAVFYRTHSQSRILEDTLRAASFPYGIVGGMRFYDRSEVKTALAYLKWLVNPLDEVALHRIINVPSRGIGKVTWERCKHFARTHNLNMISVMKDHLGAVEVTPRATTAIQKFLQTVEHIRTQPESSVLACACRVWQESGYMASLQAMVLEPDRLANVTELKNAISVFERRVPGGTLAQFLASLHLDDQEPHGPEAAPGVAEGGVSLMTCHAAKGLEFPIVFLVGCEEGFFPHYLIGEGESKSSDVANMRAQENMEDIEEERRLFYVAMTRAKHQLVLMNATRRMINGFWRSRKPSRFLSEIPSQYVRMEGRSHNLAMSVAPSDSERRYEYEASELGQWVRHPLFGKGQIVEIEMDGGSKRYRIRFDRYGTKRIAPGFISL